MTKNRVARPRQKRRLPTKLNQTTVEQEPEVNSSGVKKDIKNSKDFNGKFDNKKAVRINEK